MTFLHLPNVSCNRALLSVNNSQEGRQQLPVNTRALCTYDTVCCLLYTVLYIVNDVGLTVQQRLAIRPLCLCIYLI